MTKTLLSFLSMPTPWPATPSREDVYGRCLRRLLLVAAASTLVACGSGGSGGDSSGSATATAAPPTPTPTPASAVSPGLPDAPTGSTGTPATLDTKQIASDEPNPIAAGEAAPAPAADTRTIVAAADDKLDPGTEAGPGRNPLQLQVHVALDGNDGWSGYAATPPASGVEGPLRTLPAAQARARALLAAMAAGQAARLSVHVVIGPGLWRLTQPLQLGPEDSGVPGAPMVWRARQPGETILSGAELVARSRTGAVGTVMSLPTAGLDASVLRRAPQLFVDGRRATLARMPDAGQYWFVQRGTALAGETGARAAFAPSAAALAWLRNLSTADRDAALVKLMQSWTSGHHRLVDLHVAADSVRISPPAAWPFLHFGTDQRFYVENVAAALDAPGEWLWTPQGLRYIVAAAEAGRVVDFELPVLWQLVLIRGTALQPVQDLRVEGLALRHTRLLTPDEGYVDGQAADTLGAVIEVDHARRVHVADCHIRGAGGYGVWLRGNVQDSVVSGCDMRDLGGGGVKLGLTLERRGAADATAGNTVHGNRIEHTGTLFPGAVGIWLGQTSHNTVSHNLVANTSYSGISVGWYWGYGETSASHNLIENNLLINIGQARLSDMGAIYTLGESPGTVIRGNLVHQVRAYPGYGAGAWGLYNDQASTGIVWERNVVIGTDDGGYLLHYGRGLTVRQNLLAFGARSEVRVTRSDPLTRLAFQDNLLLPAHGLPFVAFASAPDVQFSANRVSSRVLQAPANLDRCGAGCSPSQAVLSVGSDPRQVTLTEADPATAQWVAEVAMRAGPPGLPAAEVPAITTALPPPAVAPPMVYEADIAGTAVGSVPVNLRVLTGNSPGAIGVHPDAGTPSGKSLRFADSALITPRWEPYAWATLNHGDGRTEVAFSLRVDAGSDFLHEWRDNATSFRTGPALRIHPLGVYVAGLRVAAVRPGEWMHYRISANLGAAAGRWTLVLTYADGETVTVNDLPVRNSDWQRLNWLGFISDAVTTSTASVGYIRADNVAP